MELHQLRYVLAVVEHGTFTAAAAACYVAQPSLSHAVGLLERELGVELFHRIGRRVVLTAAGEAFVEPAREALRAIDTLRAEVASVAGAVTGRLDLVALPTLAVDPVAPLVGAFRRAHPGVSIRLAHPDDTAELARLVRSGASEVGVTELPVVGERLVARPIGPQELVGLLPPGTPRPRRLELSDLARRPVVTQAAGTSTRDVLDAALGALGLEVALAVETDQREALVPLVLAGAGTAVVPAPMAVVARRQGAVVARLHPGLWRDLGLVHREATLSPAARAFVELACAATPRPATRRS